MKRVKIGNKCFEPVVARYSKKEAEKLVRRLKKMPKLSIQKKKPIYRISREKYRGKFTGRWLILQDCKSLNIQRKASGF